MDKASRGEWVVYICSASPGMLRQDDCAFEACLEYIAHLNKKTNKQIRQEEEKGEEERKRKYSEKKSPKNWDTEE